MLTTIARYKFLYIRGKSYLDLLLGSFVIYLTFYRVLTFFDYELHPLVIFVIIPLTAILFIAVGKIEDNLKGFTSDLEEIQKRNPQIQRIENNLELILKKINKMEN